jgi:hypothetical protein
MEFILKELRMQFTKDSSILAGFQLVDEGVQ